MVTPCGPWLETKCCFGDESETWIRRCPKHNAELCLWRRQREWSLGAARALVDAPKGMRRAFLLTLTVRHAPEPREYDSVGESIYPHDTIAERFSAVKGNFQRLARSAAWKRHVAGSLWSMELTTKEISRCVLHPQTKLVRTPYFESRLEWSIHPHVHAVLVGKRWDMNELRSLCKKYGFDGVDIRQIGYRKKDVVRSIRYVSKYSTKMQDGVKDPRTNNTQGVVRSAVADVRRERAMKRSELRPPR